MQCRNDLGEGLAIGTLPVCAIECDDGCPRFNHLHRVGCRGGDSNVIPLAIDLVDPEDRQCTQCPHGRNIRGPIDSESPRTTKFCAPCEGCDYRRLVEWALRPRLA